MKKIYILFSLCLFLVFFSANAQETVIYNGEDVAPDWWPAGSASEVGNHWDNPLKDAVNSTNKVASILRNPDDDPWTGGGLGGLTLASADVKRFTLMVLKEAAGNVQIEVQDGSGNKEFLQTLYPEASIGSWAKLEFIIPDATTLTGDITTILVAPHIDDTKADPDFTGHTMYWDELVAYPALATGIIDKHAVKRMEYFEVFSITGNLVLSRIHGIDNFVNSLKPGAYVVVKHYSNGFSESEKIVVYNKY